MIEVGPYCCVPRSKFRRVYQDIDFRDEHDRDPSDTIIFAIFTFLLTYFKVFLGTSRSCTPKAAFLTSHVILYG
jgi:hypothetical protein